MHKFIAMLLVVLVALGTTFEVAHAKRFGGGRSFGVQRTHSYYARSPQGNLTQGIRNTTKQWAAPLLGLAAGALLGALLMNHGFGSALLSWFCLAIIVMFLISLMRRWLGNASQPIYHTEQGHPSMRSTQISDELRSGNFARSWQNSQGNSEISATLEREAKALFLRLQSAYDQKDLNDLRKFTSPEVFAEIKLQLDERGDQENVTDVPALLVDILEIDTSKDTLPDDTFASAWVRFSGQIREEMNGPLNPFNETWNLRKLKSNDSWQVAGITQN